MPTLTPPKLLLALSITIFIVVLLTGVYTGRQWYFDWQQTHQTSPAKSQLINQDNHDAAIEALPDSHLFGEALVKDGKVPVSNLQLHVTGIVKVNSEIKGAVSKAYISIAGQPSKIYQIGDDLAYGVKIYEITKDMVIVQNDGHLEKLPLPREPLAFKARIEEESV